MCWLPRGAANAAEEPADFGPLEEDAGEEIHTDSGNDSDGQPSSINENMISEVDKARAVAAAFRSGGQPAAAQQGVDAQMAELNMDQYDAEEGSEAPVQGIFGSGNPGMSYYKSNVEDPYITLDATAEHSESDAEDNELRETDFIILAARNEDDVSHLEVWVYEDADEDDGNLYVHHDILLPEFPLCLAWLDCPPSSSGRETGNLAAVGSMSPGIEIWNLNIADAVEPLASLGGLAASPAADASPKLPEDATKQKKAKRKSQKPELRKGSHKDAVLGLSWNQSFRNVLASASADKRVKIWDVATQTCERTLKHHTGKVQAVAWNPAEAAVLLSGGYDRKLALVDARSAELQVLSWTMAADLEALAWSPAAPTTFLASAEDGIVAAFDARAGAGSDALYRLAAHDQPTCALSFCPGVPGLLCTASTDGTVKLWDVASQQPSIVASAADLNVGAIFTAGFCGEASWLIAAGGSKGAVAVWDIATSPAVQAKYGRALAAARQGPQLPQPAAGGAVTS